MRNILPLTEVKYEEAKSDHIAQSNESNLCLHLVK